MAMKSIKIKLNNHKSTFWSEYMADLKRAFAKKSKPDMTKIQTDEEYKNEVYQENWKDSKISRDDFAIYQIHKEIDRSLDHSKPGYHCPIPKLIDVKVKKVHPLDNYSSTINKNISALDQGLSIGITETYLDEEGIGGKQSKPILKTVITKKKSKKKKGDAYLDNSV